MERIKFKDIVFYAVVWGAVVLLSLIVLTAAFRAGPSALQMPFFIGFAYLLAAALAIVALYKFSVLSKISSSVFIVILLLAVLIPRLLWVYFVRTQPFSDFLHIYNYGVSASQGNFKDFVDFYAVFPFKISFGMVLAGLYSIFGTGHMVAVLLNVVLSVVLAVLLYAGGKLLYSENAGRTAALLCALWPAQIMYTSVIAAENLFLVLFTAAVLLVLKFIKKYSYKNYQPYNGNLLLAAAGVLTALAQLVRPMAMILLPVFAVFVLIYKRYRASIASSLGLGIKSILVLAISYFAVISLVNIPIQNVSGVDVSRSGSGFNLMIGTNSSHKGMWNQEDFDIIEKHNFDFDKVHAEAQKIAINRIKDHPKQFLRLAVNKYEILWGNENFGYYWSVISAGNSNAENFIKSHPRIFYAASQAFYILILLMAIGACLYTLREKRYDLLIILMIFGGIVISYTFLEVQSRYHLPVMPLLILFGAGLAELRKPSEI